MYLKTIYDIRKAILSGILTEETLQVLLDRSDNDCPGADVTSWRWGDFVKAQEMKDIFELHLFAVERGYIKSRSSATLFLSFVNTFRYSQKQIATFFELLPKINYTAKEIAAGVHDLGTRTAYDTVRYIADRCNITSDEANLMPVEEIMHIVLSDRRKAIYERNLKLQK